MVGRITTHEYSTIIIRDYLENTMSARALSNRIARQYPQKKMRITYLSDATLDCRMRGVYFKLLKNDVKLAREMVNDTIWTLNNAENECSDTVKYCSPIMYKILVDLSLDRITEAHDKIRSIHYYIYNKYL